MSVCSVSFPLCLTLPPVAKGSSFGRPLLTVNCGPVQLLSQHHVNCHCGSAGLSFLLAWGSLRTENDATSPVLDTRPAQSGGQCLHEPQSLPMGDVGRPQ